MKKKLPDITLNDWLQAEAACRIQYARPPGINAVEYCAMRNISLQRAQKILKTMSDQGLATREWWANGTFSCYVYNLKKKK